MKYLFILMASFSFAFISAEETEEETFSRSRMKGFYGTFFCEEKQDLASANLTVNCAGVAAARKRGRLDPPDIPPKPLPKDGYFPVVLVNNSTLPDTEVFLVITGEDTTPQNNQSFVSINISTGVGTLVYASPGDNALNYSWSLGDLPLVGSNGRLIYLPPIISAAVWISMPEPLSMAVNSPNNIVQPDFFDTSSTNLYDFFELNYQPGTTPIFYGDVTAVGYFSIPLYGYISTPSPGSASYAGLYQPKSYIMSYVESVFATAPEASEWNKLFLRNGDEILRVLSPGKAMSTSPAIFDINYLDNLASYGYSYITNIWKGTSPNSFYRSHPLVMTIPNGSDETYTGVINSDNTITFTSSPSGYVVVFSAPTTTFPTTTYNIFSGLSLVQSDTSPKQADGVQLYKLFEEAIIASLIPTANTVSNPYLLANQSSYYTVNPNLTSTGQSTGPWFDLYSKALHALGNLYTFTYDEPLWPLVQITSQTVQPDTYLGITIGPID